MRLIHTTTLELSEHLENNAHPYAILSHTWGDEEVSFQQMTGNKPRSEEGIEKRSGHIKILDFCKMAKSYGYDYAWVDTICIDKTSSSELSEAINSMFQWYQKAGICFVYLSDVHLLQSFNPSVASSRYVAEELFRRSRWFTRGWTLQELIAPQNVRFFNSEWKLIGSKYDLRKVISNVTAIDENDLFPYDLAALSAARKMSWAAERQTTRIEDRAYCLLGIFGITMPLLYGEGERAFIRLQEEILRQTEDYSVLAFDDSMLDFDVYNVGVLAQNPSCFRGSGDIESDTWIDSDPFSVTSRGLRLNAIVWNKEWRDYMFATIPCYRTSDPTRLLWLPIWPVSGSSGMFCRRPGGQWGRMEFRKLPESEGTRQVIYLQTTNTPRVGKSQKITQCWFRSIDLGHRDLWLSYVHPQALWGANTRVLALPQWSAVTQVAMVFDSRSNESFVVFLRLNPERKQSKVAVLIFRTEDRLNMNRWPVGMRGKLKELAQNQEFHDEAIQVRFKEHGVIFVNISLSKMKEKTLFCVDIGIRLDDL